MNIAYEVQGYRSPGSAVGHRRLFRMSPPLDGHQYVIASTSTVYGVETYLFPADSSGEITDWGDLDGSLRGVYEAEACFNSIGYQVQEEIVIDAEVVAEQPALEAAGDTPAEIARKELRA